MKPGDLVRKPEHVSHSTETSVGGRTAYIYNGEQKNNCWFGIHPDHTLDIPPAATPVGIVLATIHEPEATTEDNNVLPARDFILFLSSHGLAWYKWDEVLPFEVIT